MKKLTEAESIAEFNAMVNELYKIYKEWLNAFPFDLEIFKHIREGFEKELPIIKNNELIWYKKRNEAVIDLYSNKTFLIFLAERTTKLLSEINTLTMLESGKINDIEKHSMDLIVKERRLKLQSQVKWSRFNKPDYLNSISEWLQDEKQFISDITPYLDKYPLDNTKKRKKYPAKYYALYHRILIETKEVSPFELVNDTELPKKLVQEYGEVNYGFPDGQSFYREFAKLNTATPLDIARSFGKGYKQKVIEISQSCAQVIKHLEKYPN